MAQQREAWEAIHGLRFPSVTVSHVPWTSIPRKFLHVGIVLATELAPQSDLPKAILHVSECATLADYQVRLLHASGCASVYVVLGAEAERAREELAAHQTIVNELWRQGRVSSIQAVLKALDRYDGCLIVPVDALGILDDTLQLVIETAEVGEHAVIRPSYDQHPGRLLWLNRVAAAEVAVLCATSDTSFDEFLSSHAHLLPVDDPAILTEITEPDDFERIRSHSTGERDGKCS